jgi:hypothetical protein
MSTQGYTVGHRYTIEVTRKEHEYDEDESSPIKEEACASLHLGGPP